MCGAPAELWQSSHDEKVTAFLKDPGCPLITFHVETVPGSAATQEEGGGDETPVLGTLVVVFGMPYKQVCVFVWACRANRCVERLVLYNGLVQEHMWMSRCDLEPMNYAA